MIDSELWVITTYFNPLHYVRRLNNYRFFRNKLGAPLITVELGYDGKFELGSNDADILLQIPRGHVMWQKERLLNIALCHVPPAIKFVAWLDSDIIFEKVDWPESVIRRLKDFPIVQTFSHSCRLEQNVNSTDEFYSCKQFGQSSAYFVNKGLLAKKPIDPNVVRLRKGRVGYGWAAHRDILDKYGFYDAMIIGGGDLVMACAAYGWFDDAIRATSFNINQTSHYLAWARPFFERVRGNVDYATNCIFHLWHGDIKNRRYEARHIELANRGFNPYKDIIQNEFGCWEFTGNNADLEVFLKEYFLSRKEDG